MTDSMSSYRWQSDRKLSLKEKVVFLETVCRELKTQRDQLDKENIKLAIRVAQLERLLAFKPANDLGVTEVRE